MARLSASIPPEEKPSAPAAWRAQNLSGLRLVLAMVVVYSHSFRLALASRPPLAWVTRNQLTEGTLAVELFFVISGMLVTASWFRCGSLDEFLRRRILRIYPGFILAMCFTAFVTLAACPEFRLQAFTSGSWIKTFLGTIPWLTPNSLAGAAVFPDVPYPGHANGSMWSLAPEFACYLFVGLLGIFSLYRRPRAVVAVIAFIYGYYAWKATRMDLSISYWSAFSFFWCGAAVYLWRHRMPRSPWLLLSAGAALVIASQIPPLLPILLPGCCALLISYVSRMPQLRLLHWCERTDLSYGCYLYAFPLQQLCAHFGVRQPLLMFAIALPLSLLCATGSWFLVEKPFLALKHTGIPRGAGVRKEPAPQLAATI